MKTIPYYLGLLIIFVACSKLEDPNAQKIENSLVLSAKDDKINLSGNGIDVTTILARLPESIGVADVSFSSTGGKFIFTNDKTIKELADSVQGNYRYASVVLRSDTLKPNELAKDIYVTAEVTGIRERLHLRFVN